MRNTHLTKSDFMTGDSSPVAKVTPDFVGQIYIENSELMYIATNLDSNSWLAIQPLLAGMDDVENVGDLILNLVNDVNDLKPLPPKIKDLKKDIDELNLVVENHPTIPDIHEILKETINLSNYCNRKPVNNKFLGYDALINDLQRRLNALELKTTVGCMGITAPQVLNLNSNDPVVLNVQLSPYNTTDLLEFTSTNSNIVTVDRGVLQPQGVEGSAIIKITCGSRKAECTVNITLSEEVEVIDGLISTSDDLYIVDGHLVAPIISSIPDNIQIKYLVWELHHNNTIISVGAFQTTKKLLHKVTFNCSYLDPKKDYEGAKIVAKKYDPTTGTFKIVGNSNDIILRFNKQEVTYE